MSGGYRPMASNQLRARRAPLPSIENGKVVLFRRKRTKGRISNPPKRRPNSATRTREYLTPDEAGKLIRAAQYGRHGQRDMTALLLAYRHGFRVSELVSLRWEQIDLKAGLLHISRLKNGTPSTHPLRGPELR